MAFEDKVVRTVIEVLHDGEKGFSALSTELKEPRAKAFFMQESATRGEFATELETALSSINGKDVSEGGTASGTLHRTWGELKAKLGGNDHTLLETAEQGEDAAKKAYEEALRFDGIPTSIRALLQEQQAHILQSHNAVKAMRDSLAAA